MLATLLTKNKIIYHWFQFHNCLSYSDSIENEKSYEHSSLEIFKYGRKRKEAVVDEVVENASPKEKTRVVKQKGKNKIATTIASDSSEVEESPSEHSMRIRGQKCLTSLLCR